MLKSIKAQSWKLQILLDFRWRSPSPWTNKQGTYKKRWHLNPWNGIYQTLCTANQFEVLDIHWKLIIIVLQIITRGFLFLIGLISILLLKPTSDACKLCFSIPIIHKPTAMDLGLLEGLLEAFEPSGNSSCWWGKLSHRQSWFHQGLFQRLFLQGSWSSRQAFHPHC